MPAADKLISFVTFSRKQHDIARSGKLHRLADSRFAVRYHYIRRGTVVMRDYLAYDRVGGFVIGIIAERIFIGVYPVACCTA